MQIVSKLKIVRFPPGLILKEVRRNQIAPLDETAYASRP
jgi:hypothetical protein